MSSARRRSKSRQPRKSSKVAKAPKKSMGSKPHTGKRQQKTRTFTKAQILRALKEQREQRKQRKQRQSALAARDAYKPRKKDYGKFVFVGTKGQKDPQRKGRKGYLLYVTKTGKKWLVKQKGRKQTYQARKLTDIEPPVTKSLRKKATNFQRARRELVSQHRAVVKGKGEVTVKGAWDFNEKIVRKIADSLKRTIERQASKRTFLIEAMVLVELPEGTTQVFNVTLPIDKPDHIAIEIGGMINFVRLKFYAFLARELAYAGFVTSGSANHIRRLKDNKQAEPGEYVDKMGQSWVGNDLEIVKIRSIEWRIEQVK